MAIFIIFLAHRNHQLKNLRKEILEKREELLNAATSFRSILNSEYYISKAEYSKWHTSYNQLKPIVQDSIKKKIKTEFNEELQELGLFFENGNSLIKKKNEKFIQAELEKYQDFFDIIETHSLTENQRQAIVTEEKHNLIVAGAGTGKTSTLIGKAGYILQKGLAEPNEILFISFARKVKNEIKERALARLGQKLRVDTFHSLGLSIIAEVEKKKPSLSELSTDPLKLPNAIMEFIKKRHEDRDFLRELNRYFAFHKTPYKSKFNFTSMGEYIDYLRSNQVRSLNGDLVKSLEECEIANFLYLNGVDYVYEGNYKIDVASRRYRQYKPDFFLPEYDIYIEHFGVDRNNMTAPFVDRKKYLAEMEWKRHTHQKNNTILIETYSWEKSEGVLLENLERNLLSAGVEFAEIPPEQVFDKLNKLGLVH
ncbi:MAG: helicase IV, partial [Candidatus Heimdallarchaeota archaeon]